MRRDDNECRNAWQRIEILRRVSVRAQQKTPQSQISRQWGLKWRGPDLNRRPRGYEPREQTSCSTPRHSEGSPSLEAKLRKRQYKINEDKMSSLEECQRNYRIAVQKRWIDDSKRSELAYFSCWAKVVRKKREGVTESPAALLVYVLKNELLHVYPDNVDEQKALRILRELRLSEFNDRMAA